MSIDYGFDSTDNVQYDQLGLPVGTYKALIAKEEIGETKKDTNPEPLIVTFEALEGEFKGKSGRVYYNVRHTDATTSNIAKQALKRIADATGKPVTPATPLKGRVLTLEVRQQKKNPDFTEIAKYHPENYKPEVAAPF